MSGQYILYIMYTVWVIKPHSTLFFAYIRINSEFVLQAAKYQSFAIQDALQVCPRGTLPELSEVY